MVPIVGGGLGERGQEWMVVPERPVTAQATRIHGISNADLAAKPKFSEIANKVMALLEGSVIVGHNVSVDAKLLKDELLLWQPPLMLDTLKLARRVFPGRSSYGLAALVADCMTNADGFILHRAAADEAPRVSRRLQHWRMES